MSNAQQKVTLHPSPKNYLGYYFLGILTLPLLVGFIFIWLAYKRQNEKKYFITNSSIGVEEQGVLEQLSLVDIQQTNVKQTAIQRFLNIGSIELNAKVSSIVLEGIDKPTELLSKIDAAIAFEKEKLQQKKTIEVRRPTHNPGTIEKMDQLTGMWQQGLISYEDYENERKKLS